MDIKRRKSFCLIFTIILCLLVKPIMSFATEDIQPVAEEGNIDNNIDGNNNGVDNDLLEPGNEGWSDEPVIESKSTEASEGTEDSDASGDTNDGSGDDPGQNLEGGAEGNNPGGTTGEGEENENGDDDGSGDEFGDTQDDGQTKDDGQSGDGEPESGPGKDSGQGGEDGTGETQGAETGSGTASSIPKDPYHTHQYIPVVTDPTCTEKGCTTYTCSCGDSYVDDYKDPLGHKKVVDVPEVPATTSSIGTTAGKKCEVCGEILEGCEEIPALTEVTREFDKSVITGFKVQEPGEIREEIKPILDELNEQFPSEITIFLGGSIRYKSSDSNDAGKDDSDGSDGDDGTAKPDDGGSTDNTDKTDSIDNTADNGSDNNGSYKDKTDKTNKYEDSEKREGDDSDKDGYSGSVISGEPEGAERKTVPVTWICRQDYDEDLPVFEFVPELEGYELAPGISLPIQRVYVGSLADGPVGGHIPSGTGGDVPFAVSTRKGAPSASFNAYESGLLPPVRNQGSEGACWSFAAIGSMEADLIQGGWDRNTIDLSELYLAYYATHKHPDPKGCHPGDSIQFSGSRYLSNGGNNELSYRAMANMEGPVAESTAPYPNGSPNGPNVAQMTGAYLYNPSDRSGIKAAILAHGGVDAAMYWDSSYFGSSHNAYYYPYTRANHEVMLVGWDDSFPASYFKSSCQPVEGKDGAWLVRNSWGKQGYGSSGYFWMSYYDAGFLSDVVTAYDAEAPRYDSCYYYDSVPYPDVTQYLSKGKKVSQSFTLKGAEVIRAVGFETGGSNVTATVTVSNGQNSSTGQAYVGNKGFYIAELSSPLTGRAGQRITVALSFNGESSFLYEGSGTAICGDTYYSSACDGGGYTVDGWTYSNDARIKLYTDNDGSGGETPIEGISLNKNSLTLTIGDHEQLYATLLPENASGALSWTSSNPNIARVDQGLVMAVGAGSADVTVRSSNGKSAACRVTVNPINVKGITIQGFTKNPKVSEISDTNENSGFVIPNEYPIVLTFRTNPLNATNQNVIWKSSNTSVAYVTTATEYGSDRKEAHVFLKNAGTAVVSVTSADGNYSDSVTFKITKTMCTLKYDANGGSGAPAQQRISKGGTLKLQTGKPTRSGYTFKGWAVSKNAISAQYQPGASYKATGSMTFYAVWQNNQKYTLSFNANGGSGAPLSQSTVAGSTVKLPSGKPTRSGYTFKGWATTNNATIARYQPGASYKPTNNTTFYAVWDYAPTIEGYVRRCYRVILGREGEQTGVDSWVSVLSSGAGAGASIVSGFMGSREFISKNYNNDQIITILYRSMLGREPDSIGKRDWLGVFDSGLSLNYVIAGFAGSQEFNGICASYGIQAGTVPLTENRDQNPKITQFITRNYNHALNRNGDVQGLNDWTDVLLQREATPKEVSFGFIFSPECLAKNLSNSDFVYMLYHLYMGRDPDPQGLSDWVRVLDEGYSREHVANGFADSPEFQAIVRSYGL